ncbi:MAG: glutamate-5-semialdehyde dehydrogenase [Candidatus Binatia bacterium]
MTTDEVSNYIAGICRQAREAARNLSTVSDEVRSAALLEAAARLRDNNGAIRDANVADVDAGRQNGMSAALIDRLALDDERVELMAAGVELVAALPDPLADPIRQWTAPSGIEIEQRRIPIGVVGVIYESRPNVTADVTALCIKSGNAVVLKGGKEAIKSNSIIADLLGESLVDTGVPENAVQLVRRTERSAATALLGQEEYVDMLIPRGGPDLVRAIATHSRIPVIKHYEGICHTYVDEFADLSMAEEIVINAKVQRPGVCNAMETLLIHGSVAEAFCAAVGPRLTAAGVELRACERALPLLPGAVKAVENDWKTEYLDMVLSVKVVDSLQEAVAFINRYGSGHSDTIVTSKRDRADRFLAEVDSAVVYQNASTRFTDGYAFGFGAEVGISTNRIHARGPMGLRELTTYKYVVRGEGQIRE